MKEGAGMILEDIVCKKCGMTKSELDFYDNEICKQCKEIENGRKTTSEI